ncbi:Gliding-associated Putative ABC transporter substrate-binding component GldG [Croceitalea dokdonensis DOKDO 023]|uniref:Gliding-associated Putative ABC transporter substrate-binding component GldG n=1 Tax=Croceitalea dokdonensis DOKDO 023 TaxID=1300341 RepID=A0A0P7AJN0_9FLAO|nr:gliding motility-associated ABC transporter substrate-binding protein GldG [Croceitalea dokdonensis]KPM33851.1 Gliding-associated Putative ABC transporter substrate-binding component GldG [Croceitalea dokdonensis DOKDO 023]
MKKHNVLPLLKGLLVVILLNIIGNLFFKRFDVTEDQRYTLSQPTKALVAKFREPVIIDVLLSGDMPSEFAKLQDETKLLLSALTAENPNINFDFVNPIEETSNRNQTITELQQIGLTPANVTIEENGKVSQEIVFPWAMVNYNNNTVRVPLLKNKLGSTTEDRINNSVQELEYGFADALTKLSTKEKKKVAVLKGNGQLGDEYLADFLGTIKAYYNIGAFTLDSVENNPQKTLQQLSTYDLALIAKPTEAFSEKEKYVLDQYLVNGGKSVWLLDKVAMELDSLFNPSGSAVALQRDLNIDDVLFRYGIRINPVMVNDLYNTPIVLASGEHTESQYNPLPWVYHPMVFSKNNHPINTNIEALRLQFANVIDTLKNGYDKTILLQSSPLSKFEGVPKQIALEAITNPPEKGAYTNQGNLPLGVLVEGEFKSAYTNRVKPFKLSGHKEKGSYNKMLVVADGDIIKNQLRQGQPLPLGYDKWTNNTYGNKEFLLNSLNYLLDDTGLINIRNKKIAIPILDVEKIAGQKTKWQLINIVIPTLLVFFLIFGFNQLRKRKLAR